MSGREPTASRAASVRQRLLDRARARGEEFQLVLDRFAVERLLYRLSVSPHRDQFLLKGALLFTLSRRGRAGFVMSSQASSAGRDEANVRQKLVERSFFSSLSDAAFAGLRLTGNVGGPGQVVAWNSWIGRGGRIRTRDTPLQRISR